MRKTSGNSDWRDGFLFVGNDPTLDFLNTRPVQNGEPVELLSDFTALMRWFQAAGLVSVRQAREILKKWGKSGRARKVTADLREFRERLRAGVSAWEQGSLRPRLIEELNTVIAAHPQHVRLTRGAGTPNIEKWFEMGVPDDLFGPLAASAANLFARADRSRVHKCDNDTCVLHFLDTSKKGARRWCSMRLCGNRLKVATYAARRRRRSP